MSSDKVLCAKQCALLQADKSYLDGMVYVYQTLIRYMPKGGTAKQKLEIPIADITGCKQSKSNPLLKLESSQVSPVLRFQSQQDRDDIVAAYTKAQTQQQAAAQAAAQPAPAAAAQAASTAAAPGGHSASQLSQKVDPQERQELLRSNPELAAQYKTLVLDHKALSEEEFWSSSAMLKKAGVAGKPVTLPRSSKLGLANKLVDLVRQSKAADSSMRSLALTQADEEQLLREKPVLRQIFDAQVPSIISREEFWQRYFRYYMAKLIKRQGALKRYKAIQESLTAESAAAVADMTGGEQQQQEMADYELSALFSALDANSGLDSNARNNLKRRLNPTVDLAAAAEDRLTADGYGLTHNAARSELEQVQGYSAVSQQLAQDYNVHAAAVMGLGPAALPAASRPWTSQAAAATAGQPGADGLSEMSEQELQRCRQQAGGSGLEDLAAPVQQQFEELRVTNPRLYFSHTQPPPQQPASQQPQQSHLHDAGRKPPGGAQQQQQQQDVVAILRSIDVNALSDRPMEPAVANKVLVELCGGDVADAARTGGTQALPNDLKAIMQQQSMLVDELLRHFWSLIPVNTQAKQDKLERIQPALVQRGDYLKGLEDSCPPGYKVSLSRLIRPLWDQLDIADKGYKEVQKQLAIRKQQKKAGRPGP